jgi:hypothetical protein
MKSNHLCRKQQIGNADVAILITILMVFVFLGIFAESLKNGRFEKFVLQGYIQPVTVSSNVDQNATKGLMENTKVESGSTSDGRSFNFVRKINSLANQFPSNLLVVASIDGNEIARGTSYDHDGVQGFFSLTFSNFRYGFDGADFGGSHYLGPRGAFFNPKVGTTQSIPLANGSVMELSVFNENNTVQPVALEMSKQPFKVGKKVNSSDINLIQLLASCLAGIIIFGLTVHFGSQIFPQSKETQLSKILTLAVSVCIALIAGLSLYGTESLAGLVTTLVKEATSAVSLAISIIFLAIGAFLVVRKVKAIFT